MKILLHPPGPDQLCSSTLCSHRQAEWLEHSAGRQTHSKPHFSTVKHPKGCTVSHSIFFFFSFSSTLPDLLYLPSPLFFVQLLLMLEYLKSSNFSKKAVSPYLNIMTSKCFRRPKCDKNNFRNQKVTILIQSHFK